MKSLYKFEWDVGRMGELDGLFVAYDKEVKAAIGKEVYFGEVLGKHSEIYGELEESELTKIDVEKDVLDNMVKILGKHW